MGIPIIQEIFDGIRWLIDFFMNKIPRPLQILIFLLFLLVFGSLISFFLQIAGVHCNSSKEVVKVDTFDVGTNIAIIWEDTDRVFSEQNLTICDAHPDKCGQEHDCYFYAEQLDSGYYTECNTTNSSVDCGYYLREGNCHNCTDTEICFADTVIDFLWLIPFCGNWHDVCSDDAYPSDSNTITDLLTGCGSACYVPENYVWNFTTGVYECSNPTICGVNATAQANPVVDQKLLRAGAERIYTTSSTDRSYTSMIRLKCNANFKPRLTFFGIDLLSYQLWLFMIVIYVLVMLMFKLRNK